MATKIMNVPTIRAPMVMTTTYQIKPIKKARVITVAERTAAIHFKTRELKVSHADLSICCPYRFKSVIAIVIAIVSPWGNKSVTDAKSAATTTAASTKWVVRDRFTLKAVDGGSGKALAGVETKGEAAALLIAGNGMTPKSTIGIWLTGKGTSGLVGFQVVNSKGQFSAVGSLPKNVQSAVTLIVTSETARPGQASPKSPGPVLLSSPFTLS
jgi:hypothetical protein